MKPLSRRNSLHRRFKEDAIKKVRRRHSPSRTASKTQHRTRCVVKRLRTRIASQAVFGPYNVASVLKNSLTVEGVGQMALTRGHFLGYEFDRMVMLFSMVDGQREISCAISTSAMDDLEGVARSRPDQRG